jgi:hypothetical protein
MSTYFHISSDNRLLVVSIEIPVGQVTDPSYSQGLSWRT